MVRVRAPTSTTWPSGSRRITTRLASHRQALGSLRRDPCATFENGLADASAFASTEASTWTTTVSLAWRAGVDAVMKRGLGQQRQSVRLLLGERRRFRGNVKRIHLGCTPKVRHGN